MVLAVLVGALLLSACGGTAATDESPSASVESSSANAVSEAFANPDEALANPDAGAEDLINAWFGLLALAAPSDGKVATTSEEVEAGMKVMRTYLDPAFTLVRATGQRYTADNFVPLNVGAYELSDFVVAEPREDVRVIRFFVTQAGTTSPDAGVVMSEEKAPRIVVLRWDEELGHWVMVSYANFNSAVAAICDQDPIVISGKTPNTSPEELALAASLVEKNVANATGKSTEQLAHPDYQVQFADGQGWPSEGEAMIDDWTPAQSYEVDNVGVTRNDDLLVLSYDAAVKDVVNEGDDYRDAASPRLYTYLRSPEGKWQQIALGNFNVPEDIPADTECVSVNP